MRVLIWSCGPEPRSAAPYIYTEAKRQGYDVYISGTRSDPERFMRVFKQVQPDFVFCLALRPNLVPYYKHIRKSARLLFWYPDQTETHRDIMWRTQLNNVADVLVFSILDTAQRYSKLAPMVTWMPQYFDDQFCRKDGALPPRLNPKEEIYDLVFIGSCDAKRRSWLAQLKDKYKCNFITDCIGTSRECRGWAMAHAYAQAKIAINIQRSLFMNEGPYVTSNRIYNAMGSGAFFINHVVQQMELVFQEGIHCVSIKECKLENLEDAINWWLCMQPDDRENIAWNGKQQVLQYHTLEIRVAEYWYLMQSILDHGFVAPVWPSHKSWLQTTAVNV